MVKVGVVIQKIVKLMVDNNMNNKLFELIEELSDKIDRGMKDCFELNDFILFKNDIDWRLLKVIIKEENEEGFSSKWDELEDCKVNG